VGHPGRRLSRRDQQRASHRDGAGARGEQRHPRAQRGPVPVLEPGSSSVRRRRSRTED
jgi:hypothetical protein